MISFLRIVFCSILIFSFSKCSLEEKTTKTLNQNKGFFALADKNETNFQQTPKNFKVAFLGDSGRGRGFERVLNLVKKEKAGLVVHLGDFSYDTFHHYGAEMWNDVVNEVLGESFPYFLLVGNHEALGWTHYIDIFQRRLSHLPPQTCFVESGRSDLGVKSYCQYKGIFFLLSGVGSKGLDHENFIERSLERYKNTLWKVCAWHKNQGSLQLGHKTNETGWGAYKLCQKYGAFITTGHEHSYGRTRVLTDVGNELSDHGVQGEVDTLNLSPGKTFTVVAGTGGKSLRPYNCLKGSLASWWASIFTTNYVVKNGKNIKAKDCLNMEKLYDQERAEFGAFFMTFNYKGEASKALAQFITTEGRVLDEFMVTTK